MQSSCDSNLDVPRLHPPAMKILLIEDDEKVARAVSTGLEAERFAVDWVSDGCQSGGDDGKRLRRD